MPKITFMTQDGARYMVDAAIGESVMEAARKHAVPGILADCGGACACATCHVYIREEWLGRAEGPGGLETDMLDMAEDVLPSSRLSCQIQVTDALDGLVVDVPSRQALA